MCFDKIIELHYHLSAIMKITVTPQPKSQVKFDIELSVEDMQPYLGKAAQHLSEHHHIEGFRPGKASLGIVLQKLGTQAVWQEAAEEAVRKSYVAALRQEKIRSIGQPHITITKIAPDNPLAFTAVVATLPEVKLGDYKKFKAKRPAAIVTDEQKTKALDDLRAMFATEALVDRAARAGDKVEVDFEVALNNVPLEHGASKQHPVVIGSKQFIPGFEEQLIGMKKGEKKEFSLTFPKEYHKPDVAGKLAQFKASVTSVFEVNQPVPDDLFAKKVGKFETLEQLKAHLHGNLQAKADEAVDAKYESLLVDELIGRTKFGELPDLLIESEIGKMISELEEQIMRQSGANFDDYLKSIGQTESALRQEFRTPAERRVKAALVIRTLAESENITVDDAAAEKEVQSTLKIYEHDPEIKRRIDTADYRDYVRAMLVNRKVIQKLKAWAAE